MKWYEVEDVCPSCGQEEDNHRSNCPNNPSRQKKSIKKIKNTAEQSYG